MTTRGPLTDLLRPAAVVAADADAADVRRRLLGDGAPRSIVVRTPARPELLATEVVLRTPTPAGATVADLRCCSPEPLAADVDVRVAVARALGRDEPHRHHDLLVEVAGRLHVLAVSDLLGRVAMLHTAGAQRDSLTGLPGRAGVTAAIESALRVEGTGVAVAFMDLDRFKEVNDRHGHAIGDRILHAIAQRLDNTRRHNDVVGRIGGDEFVAVLHVQDADEARLAAERLRERVTMPIEQGTVRVEVGISVGVALARPGDGTDAQRLLADGDALMYLAKQRGGGVLVADEVSDQLVTRSQLAGALAGNELTLHYQPIVPLDGTPFDAVEALVRWPMTDGTHRSPAAFVPLAESTGQVVDLDWWAISTAVEQLVAWDALARGAAPWHTHVNLSARTLAMPGVVSHVERIVELAGIDPARLTLEVTETAIIGDVDRARQVLTALRGLGVGTAIDDFGVGQSSLAQLSSLPVSSLKIDRAFVVRLAEREVDRGVVRLIRTLATELGLDVVAEGVESQEQAEVLRELGVTHAQGWLWSPAVDGATVRSVRTQQDAPVTA